MLKQNIIDKYNIPVPRYTSYPTANNFVDYSNESYYKAIEHSNQAAKDQLSFYIHIPFCHHLCHYCGCNSFPMSCPETVESYVKALHCEIDLLNPHLKKTRRISQIHYGGGSPTSLPIHHIKELNEHLFSSFETIDKPEIAIECHPGYLTEKDWKELITCGFTRYSLGIQDFNTQVLKIVNRRPSLIPVNEITSILHESGARFNLDFIYGLPQQTISSFVESITKAIQLNPDRLVTFSYAHVPWINKRQMILEKAGLPSQQDKMGMFVEAAAILEQSGYKRIGMDHFVRPDDDLYQALLNHQLHRNFQGYCPRRITAQVYALGVSGISQLETAYAQNTKDIPQYISNIKQGKLCITKGYDLNRSQQITREAIESLMCNYCIDWNDLASLLGISAEEVQSSTGYTINKMNELANDGLIEFDNDKLQVTADGVPFVRNIAASLDPMIMSSEQRFSKPI